MGPCKATAFAEKIKPYWTQNLDGKPDYVSLQIYHNDEVYIPYSR